MSARRRSFVTRPLERQAPVFAALGDPTRLSMIAQLGDGGSQSITELKKGAKISRQGITKHLRVLEGAGLVRSVREGRETRFMLELEPLRQARDRLGQISDQWDQALARLKAFVEK